MDGPLSQESTRGRSATRSCEARSDSSLGSQTSTRISSTRSWSTRPPSDCRSSRCLTTPGSRTSRRSTTFPSSHRRKKRRRRKPPPFRFQPSQPLKTLPKCKTSTKGSKRLCLRTHRSKSKVPRPRAEDRKRRRVLSRRIDQALSALATVRTEEKGTTS